MSGTPKSGAQGGGVRERITPPVVPADPELNITDLLHKQLDLRPQAALFSVPKGDVWRDISTREFVDDVNSIAKGFIAAGVQPGDRIAFLCVTSYEWTLVDYALMTAGAVMVPVYETSSASQLAWMLSDSGAKGILAEDEKLAGRYDEIGEGRPEVQWRWTMSEGALDQLREAGTSVTDAQLEQARTQAKADDVATIIYTSGSTGRPKGTVLTHANFVELVRNIEEPLSPFVRKPGSSTLLFITLAHVFARLISILCVSTGVKVGHQHDTSQLVPALGSFRPTFLLAVPRVFEKVYNSALQKATEGGKRKIFERAVKIGVAYSRALDEAKVPLGLKLQFKLYDRLVFKKLRETLGGRVEHAVSGSAPLGLFLGHFYRALGVQVLEGYGLTETTAPVSVNLPGAFKVGTVGPPLPGVGVRIDDDDEILVKGVGVFREYLNNPEATADAFTEDGWFRTGDLGRLDADGYLTITGRKKDIIVTAGGKNVAPATFEDPIRADTIVGECVVVGDQKPFISAVITLDPEMLPKWLETQGLDPNLSLAEAAENDKVRAHLKSVIDSANTRVSRAESIREFRILDYVFSIDDGTLTPKLSIKRNVVLERIAPVIAEIYSKTSSVPTL
ncbi:MULTISPECIES: AMP-dependent synthetase/ligase [Gulosibacter]|uniref:AMP-dependent synthetase/ligase n=1 Tax=Gulosibacter TaxID=256818 RepID=UPI000F642650|nr:MULTISPECIES: AMP-dependent synthetase/ligase [Gulosibacter]